MLLEEITVVLVVEMEIVMVGSDGHAGFWNVNGWPVDVNTDKYKICSSSILKCDFDICSIAETHLMGHSNPILDGYTVFTNNRKNIHKRAKCGSGGVAYFVKQSVMLHYNVNILDESVEDILWVQFEHTILLLCINVCVCYLSPDGSSHIVDPHSYVDKLLSQIYIYQTRGQFIICGDFMQCALWRGCRLHRTC